MLTYNQIVVDTPKADSANVVFRALADSTRRDILRRCIGGGPSVSRLAEHYPMSFAAVQKHVAILERAGLVRKERNGREQLVRTEPSALTVAHLALDELEHDWRGRIDRMSDLLAEEKSDKQNQRKGAKR